ncbi:PTS fructose transporter subunit IIA [uncultured Dubosiella sp.]|jgi:PTS system N-acetylgalactosamine-specific IIA component|uniref:PTS sugar transporter subunit IIA domain-containing protein n=1 Tax=uncultured Dubosiella sp. TaxID=1937011 RepID=UPI00208116AD|nr:PTS fructose transporter subunit IIA [uncultured Dubosiella sp.]GJM58352.1 hypothetical protein EROP_20450 [Erysipelotrichaceae bacterium OPF54]
MIGIIITGHGRFASGMKSALEVIAGECENVKTVDFEQGCSVQHFEEKMRETIERQHAVFGQVIICADLVGGTPFKSSVLLTLKNSNVQVAGGTNLGLLLEVQAGAKTGSDAQHVLQNALEMCAGSMTLFKKKKQ